MQQGENMQNPRNFYPKEWFVNTTAKSQSFPIKKEARAAEYDRQRLPSGCVLLTMSLKQGSIA
jgi:hypothetical protein